MAIPTRHVDGVVSRHLFGFHNQIFENLIQCRADVDVPIRIGRAVMQDVLSFPLGGLAQRGIELHVLPNLQAFLLTLR